VDLSKRKYKGRDGSRWDDFMEIDKPALRPLPAQRYEIADIVQRRVGDNYHLEYSGFYYSAPYTLHGEQVVLRATAAMIEVYDKNHLRMASHKRKYTAATGRYVTDVAHMPPNHRAVHEARQFDGKRYRSWAKNIGENTLYVIERLLSDGAVEEQGYRACMGILQLSQTFDSTALEMSCKKARSLGSCTFSTVKGIMKNNAAADAGRIQPAIAHHENIRGGDYYK
jgi:hypothetical protein